MGELFTNVTYFAPNVFEIANKIDTSFLANLNECLEFLSLSVAFS